MKITLFCFVGILLIAFAVMADAGESQAVPQVVSRAFAKKYPNTKASNWGRDSHGYWEATFTRTGQRYRADFTANGRWIETERSIQFNELPEAVKKAIKDQYPGEKLNEIELVDSASKGQFYDVEFKRTGPNKDVEYRATGLRLN